MNVVYVAGKITGDENYRTKFEKAKERLSLKFPTVLIPSILPESKHLSHADYMHMCFAMIDVADGVVFLEDWEDSVGAKIEMEYAKNNKLPTYFIEEVV